jgi:hypothetical protein
VVIPAIASKVEPTSEKEIATKKPKEDLTVKCGYCDTDVMRKYITAHVKIHIADYVPEVVEPTIVVTTDTTTDVAPVVDNKVDVAPASVKTSSLISFLTDKDDVCLKTVDHFQYKEIANLSVSASSSEDKRFSDFTVTVWLKERPSAYPTHYAGTGTWQTSKEFERIVINTTYDAIDEYYSVSVRLVKNNQYSTFSSDEAAPERLCFDQTEISEEIKRALLFFKVPPRSVYKRFLKAIRKENFVIERDNGGRIEYVQTENEDGLFAYMKSQQTIPKHTGYGHGYGC